MTICKNCKNEIIGKRSDADYCSVICGNRYRNRTYYKKHPEKILESRRKNNANVEKRILSRIKHRAKQKGIPFDLEVEDIIVPDKCPVLGLKLKTENQGSGYHADSASVDRIDPFKGYVKGNIRVISSRANLLKNDATVEELRLVLKDLERFANENSGDGL